MKVTNLNTKIERGICLTYRYRETLSKRQTTEYIYTQLVNNGFILSTNSMVKRKDTVRLNDHKYIRIKSYDSKHAYSNR